MVTFVNSSRSAYLIDESRFNMSYSEISGAAAGREWINRHWYLSVYIGAIYLMVIFFGKHFMKKRQPFDLRKVLFTWNLCLAIFSIGGVLACLPELLSAVKVYGFHSSVCNPFHSEGNKKLVFWAWLFAYSKIIELGDTMFVVLRKQPLLFLHWYHHITVLLYCWFCMFDVNAPALWFATMNFTVHSFMYSYYALKAARVRISKNVSMFVTILQLQQMIIGIYINVYTYNAKSRGEYCGVPYRTMNAAMLMYFSYCVLFMHFFYKAYYYLPKNEKHAALKSE